MAGQSLLWPQLSLPKRKEVMLLDLTESQVYALGLLEGFEPYSVGRSKLLEMLSDLPQRRGNLQWTLKELKVQLDCVLSLHCTQDNRLDFHFGSTLAESTTSLHVTARSHLAIDVQGFAPPRWQGILVKRIHYLYLVGGVRSNSTAGPLAVRLDLQSGRWEPIPLSHRCDPLDGILGGESGTALPKFACAHLCLVVAPKLNVMSILSFQLLSAKSFIYTCTDCLCLATEDAGWNLQV